MSIVASKDGADVYNAGQNVKLTVNNAAAALQNVVSSITVMQGLPGYNAEASASDKALLSGISSTATSIISQINGINWTY
jgi:hypothetical protein